MDHVLSKRQQKQKLARTGELVRAVADAFYEQFRRTGALRDLEKLIENLQQAASLTPDGHPDKPKYFGNLGNSLEIRFQRTGMLGDLEEAIQNQQRAISLIPDHHPDKQMYFNNLGNSLQSRFQRTGMLVDLEKAIQNKKQAISLTPDGHPSKLMYFSSLGVSLESRFQHTGMLGDLEEAIQNQQHAVSLTPGVHPYKPMYFSNLGFSLRSRFEHTGMLVDLEGAIQNQQRAVSLTPDGHPDKPVHFNNLGNSLGSRFERTGMLGDLEEAIQNQQQAISLTPDGHPSKPMYFSNLGTSLESRFRCTGMLGDLEEAIRNFRQAVLLTPDGHPDKPKCFNNLGASLVSQFQYTGTLGGLEEAIQNQQQAVSLTPDGHPSKSMYFDNLGTSLQSRFQCTGTLGDLEKAIQNKKQAISLIPYGHPSKPKYFNNLGDSLENRFQRTGMLSDLEQAIYNQQQAISLTPDGHPDKPRYFNNLGHFLQSRFEHTEMLGDLEKATESQQQAVSLTPDGHPDKPMHPINLGFSFHKHSSRTRLPNDLAEAITNYRLAATSNVGPVLLRCDASQHWARLETKRDPPSALLAYRHAISLLPQLAWIGDPIATRHSQLTDLDDLSREAAAFALDTGHPNLALEWLEQGRSVVWNQLIHLRTSAGPLRQAHPDICAEFTQVSRELQSAATRGHSLHTSESIKGPISLEEETQRHHRLAEKWNSLVQEIRSLPNFQDFLLPRKVSTLTEAASSGPVVVINVHERRCDALVLGRGRDQVLHIPLTKLHYDNLKKMHKLLQLYLAAPHRARRWENRAGGAAQAVGSSLIVDILAQVYSKVVYPILEGLGMTRAKPDPLNLPRIWWCPTGPLTFFPLHAAFRMARTRTEGTFDYVISSYTPTINVLLEARSAKHRPFNQLVGIAMNDTPGQSSLPGVQTEMMKISELFGADSRWSFQTLRNEQATGEQVLTHMAGSSWVHLACHAIQDKQEPTQSGFCLYDRRLTITDIVAKPFGYADFAFLSACQTATGDEKASDEAMHITAAMLGTGYRNVIGTMWAIPDEAASKIATKVYKILLSGGEPDSDLAAQALHEAVKEMRESDRDSYASWVPFVHYGG